MTKTEKFLNEVALYGGIPQEYGSDLIAIKQSV